MAEKEKNQALEEKASEAEVQELDDDDLDEVAGGTMRGKVATNKTTAISKDTKKNI